MKKHLKNLMALLLCAALLCGAGAALAEDDVVLLDEAAETVVDEMAEMPEVPEAPDLLMPELDGLSAELLQEDITAEEGDVPNAVDIPQSLNLGVKETYTLKCEGKNIRFKSSSSTVVSVSKKGKLTAKRIGQATVTVTQGNKKIGECSVSVLAAPGKVTLSDTEMDIQGLSTEFNKNGYAISAYLPENTASQITWSSSNPKVADVENGIIYGYKYGLAKITAKTFNGKKATCLVKVIGDEIPLNKYYFPDKKMLGYAKQFDRNGDKKLSADERNRVKKLKINFNTKSLSGLQYFNEVEQLTIASDITSVMLYSIPEWYVGRPGETGYIRVSPKLTKLDVSRCSKLQELYLANLWYLKDLKLGGKTALKLLWLDTVAYKQLNLSGFAKLEDIQLMDCAIDRISIDKCPAILFLDCRNCQLKRLDISASGTPAAIACGNNQLQTLDLKGRSNLIALWCDNNQLKKLDITNCPRLNNLDCSNNKLKTLSLRGCTDLNSAFGQFICDPGVKVTK